MHLASNVLTESLLESFIPGQSEDWFKPSVVLRAWNVWQGKESQGLFNLSKLLAVAVEELSEREQCIAQSLQLASRSWPAAYRVLVSRVHCAEHAGQDFEALAFSGLRETRRH